MICRYLQRTKKEKAVELTRVAMDDMKKDVELDQAITVSVADYEDMQLKQAIATSVADYEDVQLKQAIAMSMVDLEDSVLQLTDIRNNLFVKNLPKDLSEDELEALFEPFGSITSIKIEKDDVGQSKGFAYVCFSTHTEAKAAIESLHGLPQTGTKKLFVDFHIKKEKRVGAVISQAEMDSLRKEMNAVLSVQETAKKNLTCIVCFEIPKAESPVFSCLGHHLMCHECSRKWVTSCPSCKQDFTKSPATRHRLAEVMIRDLT